MSGAAWAPRTGQGGDDGTEAAATGAEAVLAEEEEALLGGGWTDADMEEWTEEDNADAPSELADWMPFADGEEKRRRTTMPRRQQQPHPPQLPHHRQQRRMRPLPQQFPRRARIQRNRR